MTFATRQMAPFERAIWIGEAQAVERLHAQGLARVFDPARLVVIHPRTHKEGLWSMEEALRGAAAIVIGVFSTPADLLQSRRLQLAAEAGGSTGLCLIPDRPVNNAAETRWRSTPLCRSPGENWHHWELLKNKRGSTGQWTMRWDDA